LHRMKYIFICYLIPLFYCCHGASSSGCGQPLPHQPHPGHHHRYSIGVEDPNLGDVTREYALHLPAHYDTSNTKPVPVMLDYHGWTGTAHDQMVNFPWREVADMDDDGFVYIALQGMSDTVGGGFYGSWNVSRTDGPLGLPCEIGLHTDYPVYTSCGSYDVENSCDWTSCHDDVVFTEIVLYEITSKYCVDLDSIHMSGESNGGMFIYTRILESFSGALASVGPVCGAPLRGFNPMPEYPINIIDMHGINDRTIPYSPDRPGNLGAGPDGTVEATDGWYYHIKMDHLKAIMATMNCDPEPQPYPTHMDGVHGWSCSQWAGCDEGKEVVHCHGEYGHGYPFYNRNLEGIMILWDFMKKHPKA